MLRSSLNKSWKEHPTNKDVFGNIAPMNKTIQQHECNLLVSWRSKEEFAGASYSGDRVVANRLQGAQRRYTLIN